MDCIILCGGKGTRVESITQNKIPKILIPVNDIPFLNYQLAYLKHYKIKKVYLAAGFKGEVLKSYVDKHDLPIKPEVIIEKEPLGTGGGLLNVLNQTDISDPFLVINGDTLLNISDEISSLKRVYTLTKQHFNNHYPKFKTPSLFVFTRKSYQQGEYGEFIMHHRNYLINFRTGKVGRGWINCGWYYFRADQFNGLSVKPMSLEDHIIKPYFKNNIAAPIYIGYQGFIDIGTAEAIKAASKLLKYKIWSSAWPKI